MKSYPKKPGFVKGSKTSKAAAKSMNGAAPSLRQKVYDYLVALGPKGATDDELEQLTELKHQTVSARRRELVIDGYVRDSGETREVRSGRQATIWVVTNPEIQEVCPESKKRSNATTKTEPSPEPEKQLSQEEINKARGDLMARIQKGLVRRAQNGEKEIVVDFGQLGFLVAVCYSNPNRWTTRWVGEVVKAKY